MINNIVIVTSEAFPYGMAGSNRIISLSKGFIANGVQTEVVSFYRYAEPILGELNPKRGTYEGVIYRNVFRSQVKSPLLGIRIIHELAKPILVFANCLKVVKKNSLILYYAEKTWPAIWLKVICRVRNSILIKEETEHPLMRTIDKHRIGRILYFKFHYRVFDGLLVITKSLKEYFAEVMHFKKPLFVSPMIVDINRFGEIEDVAKNSIVFSGSLDDSKEGITTIIRAFSIVCNMYPQLKLELFGTAENETEDSLFRSLVKELNLEEKVLFHGYKNRDELTRGLCGARLFIFARPPSLQAQFGFSTKLGEYLATGKPVIISRVGEIERYLTDGKNAYLCNPDPESIAKRIVEIQENYEVALEIGKGGRSIALKYFNNITETRRLIKYLEKFAR